VISRPSPGYLVVDAGMKAITHEFGLPLVVGVPGAKVVKLLEQPGDVSLRPGDKLELLPTHGDTTINLHDPYYGVRAGWLETVWEIPAGAGRGEGGAGRRPSGAPGRRARWAAKVGTCLALGAARLTLPSSPARRSG
jgi:hypothetical protein